MAQIGLIVLGSFLAVITSLVVEYVRIRVSEGRNKRFIRSLLKSEISFLVEILDRVAETGRFGRIPMTTVNTVNIMRQGFDRNRDLTILLKEESFRRDLFDFYNQLAAVTSEAQDIESAASQPPYVSDETLQQVVKDDRARLNTKFGDLANRGRSILQRIDSQYAGAQPGVDT